MNNFVGYLNEQPQFNLYNFTHWQYIDVLTWFASPVGILCRPWVEAAHRNGVKIIGTVFTDGPGFVALTQKDAAGTYTGAQNGGRGQLLRLRRLVFQRRIAPEHGAGRRAD